MSDIYIFSNPFILRHLHVLGVPPINSPYLVFVFHLPNINRNRFTYLLKIVIKNHRLLLYLGLIFAFLFCSSLFFHFCFLLVWKLSTLIYFCHSFLTPILNCFLTFCYTNEMFSARLIVFPYCGIEWKYYKHLSYGRTFMAHLRVVAVYLGEGNGTLLQYFCLENPMDGGAW